MVDTPESADNHDQTKADLNNLGATPQATNATPPGGEQEKPKRDRHYAQYVVTVLKAVGRGIVAVVNWTDKNNGFITALATVVIAALTGVYVHYSRAQWKVMRDQLPELHTSAEATQSAAETARKALVVGNRPWVGVDGSPTVLEIKIGQGIQSKILFVEKNFGTAPALYVNLIAETPAYMRGQKNAPDEIRKATDILCSLAEDGSKPRQIPGFWSVGPLGRYIFPANSTPEIIAINTGPGSGQIDTAMSFDIIGCIAYVDQFKELVHHTRFCFMNATTIAEVKPKEPLRPCPINEDAD